ncbi:MAG: spermine synthase [Candidatus Omnitrophota bacterium]
MKLHFFVLALLVLGLNGIVAQTTLLRELFILFAGNEFTIGVILGSWVACEAFGALWAGRFSKIPFNPPFAKGEVRGISTFIYLSLLFPLVFPGSIYFCRLFKIIFHVLPGVGLGPIPILYASLLILLPTAFLHGFIFILSCALYRQITGESTSAVGKVYFYETAGTIIGGLIITYLLLPHFNSFQIAAGILLLNASACLLLLSFERKNELPLLQGGASVGVRFIEPAGRMNPTPTFFAAMLLVLSLFSVGGLAGKIHLLSLKNQWRGERLIYYENSLIQNIAVTENEGQYTFFSNGLPRITTPVPDIVFVEEVVHFTLLSHPHPEEVLVLSGGAGGIIAEILKYPTVKRIDYAEIDPAFLQVIQKFPTPLTRKELADPRVHLHYLDGRTFVRQSSGGYDVVLLGLNSPLTLQTNRFFTEEFFASVKQTLKKGGIFSFSLPGTLTYYNQELKELNASILTGLRKAFPYHFVIPGDFNLFLASNSPELLSLSPSLMAERLAGYKIETRLITRQHLAYRLEKYWQDWFYNTLKKTTVTVNKDFTPRGLFYSIANWNLLFAPSSKILFNCLRKIDLKTLSLFIIGLIIVVFLAGRKLTRASIVWAIGTTGFAGMVLELILLFGFQVFYGYVFYEVGLLITSLMSGIAAGSFVITSRLNRIQRGIKTLLKIEAGMVVFSLLLAGLFLSRQIIYSLNAVLVHSLFLVLLFFTGSLIGMEFPLANKIYGRKNGSGTSKNPEESAGLLYGIDLLGGWVGGILGGFFLLPVLGLVNTCLLVAILKIGSLCLLLTLRRYA